MTSFIQITDTHIVPEGQLAYGVSDTEGALRRAVAAINARLPVLGPVDCVVVTGDLTDHGTAGDYQRFRAIMADLRAGQSNGSTALPPDDLTRSATGMAASAVPPSP